LRGMAIVFSTKYGQTANNAGRKVQVAEATDHLSPAVWHSTRATSTRVRVLFGPAPFTSWVLVKELGLHLQIRKGDFKCIALAPLP